MTTTRFENLSAEAEALAFEALDHALGITEPAYEGVVPFSFAVGGDDVRIALISVPREESVAAAVARARTSLPGIEPDTRCVALAWTGELPHEGTEVEAVFVEAYEVGRSAGVLFAQRHERRDGGRSRVGEPLLCEDREPMLAPRITGALRGLDEWASGGHTAIRAMVESLNGDVAAFDRDPLTFLDTLDRFVRELPLDEMSEDDWSWLHGQLAAYVAEVLIRGHGGSWEVHPDASTTPGIRYAVGVPGEDGLTRHVDPFHLVHEELVPVPQRVPRIIERALDMAGRG